jgi:hypothetical protein
MKMTMTRMTISGKHTHTQGKTHFKTEKIKKMEKEVKEEEYNRRN